MLHSMIHTIYQGIKGSPYHTPCKASCIAHISGPATWLLVANEFLSYHTLYTLHTSPWVQWYLCTKGTCSMDSTMVPEFPVPRYHLVGSHPGSNGYPHTITLC